MTAASRSSARRRRGAPGVRSAHRPAARRFDAASAASGGKLAPFPRGASQGVVAPLPRRSPPVELPQAISAAPVRPATRPISRTRTRLTPIQALPTARQPKWLKTLLLAQRSSTLIAMGLVASSLCLYGWTVYIQHLWQGEFDKMQALERQERQLTTASETLRQHLAMQAERPDSGLVLPTPEGAIFLPAPSPAPENPSAPIQAAPSPLPMDTPVGY